MIHLACVLYKSTIFIAVSLNQGGIILKGAGLAIVLQHNFLHMAVTVEIKLEMGTPGIPT